MVTVYRLVMFMELNLLFSDEEIKVSSSLTVKRKVGDLTLGSYSFASFFLMLFYKFHLRHPFVVLSTRFNPLPQFGFSLSHIKLVILEKNIQRFA
jgi:hypothetical protein